MNFATYSGPWGRTGGVICCAVVLCIILSGCSDNIALPTEQELAAFHEAGPLIPEVDLDRLMASQGGIQEYTIFHEDVLEVLMPPTLVVTGAAFDATLCFFQGTTFSRKSGNKFWHRCPTAARRRSRRCKD